MGLRLSRKAEAALLARAVASGAALPVVRPQERGRAAVDLPGMFLAGWDERLRSPAIEATLRCFRVSCWVPLREFRFHPTRKWRFDLAWPELRVAVELDGATWHGGRHTSGAGYREDCLKLNAAVRAGWRVLRYTSTDLRERLACEKVQRTPKRRQVKAVLPSVCDEVLAVLVLSARASGGVP